MSDNQPRRGTRYEHRRIVRDTDGVQRTVWLAVIRALLLAAIVAKVVRILRSASSQPVAGPPVADVDDRIANDCSANSTTYFSEINTSANGLRRGSGMLSKPIRLLGFALLFVSAGLAFAAYGLFMFAQSGNPEVSDTVPKSAVYFSVPEGVRASWSAGLGLDATSPGSIDIHLESATSPVSPIKVFVYFSGHASVEDLLIYSKDQLSLDVDTAIEQGDLGKVVELLRMDGQEDVDVPFKLHQKDGYQVLDVSLMPDRWWWQDGSGLARAALAMEFEFEHQRVVQDGSRIAVQSPTINSPVYGGSELVNASIVHGLIYPSAQSASENELDLALPGESNPLRIDYVSQLPEPETQFIWRSQGDLEISVGLTLINEEAKDQRDLFLSGVIAGLAAAFLPLALQILLSKGSRMSPPT